MPEPQSTRAQRLAWVGYDWANSGFGLIMLGPVFTPYFINTLLPALDVPAEGDVLPRGLVVLGVTLRGSAIVSLMISVVALCVAVSAPVLGAVADTRGWTRRLFIVTAVFGASFAILSILTPWLGWPWAALCYVMSAIGFGLSFPFYNAFLPRLVPQNRLGTLSGWGYAGGYIGGAAALLCTLSLSPHVALAVGGVWWLVFSLPAFVLMPEPPAAGPPAPGSVLTSGFRRVGHTLVQIRRYRVLFLFLLAFLLYSNGIETILNLSPSYGTEVIGMTDGQLVAMFLIVQGVAFVGAIANGALADRMGHRPVIAGNLAVWIAVVAAVLIVQTPGQFMIAAVVIGLVVGGAQSSSRALMAELAPEAIRAEAFGFYAVSGKAVAAFGPLVYFAVVTTTGPRLGPLSVLPFLLGGLALLMFVRPRAGIVHDEAAG